MTITLKTTCYTIHTGALVKSTLADHSQHVETTTRPTGIGPKYYTTTDTNDNWCLAKWATWGGPEVIVAEFEDEAAAAAAAEATYVRDILGNPEYSIYLSLAEAEAALAEWVEADE